MRSSGILLHITSLPSPGGVGTMGRAAYDFVDFLAAAGQRYWQILPLGPTGYGDSPYQTFSAFAGNPYLIDPGTLLERGLVTAEELRAADCGGEPEYVDYGALFAARPGLLRRACERLSEQERRRVREFAEKNADWIGDYALFMAARDSFGGRPWYEWPEDIRLCHVRPEGRETMERYSAGLSGDIDYYVGVQYLFFEQWEALRAYARAKGVGFIGDMPIYVPLDSADVWAAPENFRLDGRLRPVEVAGVPPDGFTADGQLWGHPLYDWDAMEKDGYGWWMRRLGAAERMFDVTRIDHFRAFSSYWAVPGGDTTARRGVWRPGPGKGFIDALRRARPDMRFIAEDLGYLTPDVRELVEYSGFPGMKVLEFGFDPREPGDYLPHTFTRNTVCYAGTHDNETVRQWLAGLDEECRGYAWAYMGLNDGEGPVRGVLRTGMASVSELFVAQMQDWLEKGGEARMNTPGKPSGNWRWRMLPGEASPELARRIRYSTELYGRLRTPERDGSKEKPAPGAQGKEGS
jgi:4-alpha-glucanotransferase